MEKTLKIILDTSIFVNPDARKFFGNTTYEALINFIETAKTNRSITCYMPPLVYEELTEFLETALPADKAIFINKKSPASYQANVPSLLLYEFIDEMRARVNKGLRIAEKYTRKGIVEKKEEETIKSLRDEYRVALREGILDSKEDFDLILLAKELDASLATSDNGLIKWAQKLGIACLSAQELKETITGQT